MKQPFIHRSGRWSRQHGVTMVLVALAMVAIIAMAALSIDVITLYLAREEAQRAADAAALAAARVISLSGVTGDPSTTSTWQAICGSTSPASQAATAVALQNVVGGATANSVSVTYGGTSNTDCSNLLSSSPTFSVNPTVTVQVQRTNLPNFFSRIWGKSGTNVSATSTAEAFNSSFSGTPLNTIIPVQPRCVKPWIIPNKDPLRPLPSAPPLGGPLVYCDQGTTPPGSCKPLVDLSTGQISRPGISLNGGTNAAIGETFWLSPDCVHNPSTCQLRQPSPMGNYYPNGIYFQPPPSMQYLPGDAPSTNPVAVPSCSSGTSLYQQAIAGCDQSTVYQCGVQNVNTVDLSENPGVFSNDTMNGVDCLIHEGDATDVQPDGQDTIVSTSYPFQILAGTSNPLGVSNGTPITSSSSIVSLPIYDDAKTIKASGSTQVTIVGFLQVFINSADPSGNVSVTVLNVVGCTNGSGSTYSVGSPVTGTSPVPIRLVTPQ